MKATFLSFCFAALFWLPFADAKESRCDYLKVDFESYNDGGLFCASFGAKMKDVVEEIHELCSKWRKKPQSIGREGAKANFRKLHLRLSGIEEQTSNCSRLPKGHFGPPYSIGDAIGQGHTQVFLRRANEALMELAVENEIGIEGNKVTDLSTGISVIKPLDWRFLSLAENKKNSEKKGYPFGKRNMLPDWPICSLGSVEHASVVMRKEAHGRRKVAEVKIYVFPDPGFPLLTLAKGGRGLKGVTEHSCGERREFELIHAPMEISIAGGVDPENQVPKRASHMAISFGSKGAAAKSGKRVFLHEWFILFGKTLVVVWATAVASDAELAEVDFSNIVKNIWPEKYL